MYIRGSVTVALLLMLAPFGLAADEPIDKRAARRGAIDEMARLSLERLFTENEKAGPAYDSAVGYAVFDNFKFTFLLSGGGGVGVAVDKNTQRHTYMKMGTGGLGVGLGGHSYQVVFMFDHVETFQRFVDKGWQADLSANAAAGTSGKNAPSTFTNGVAVFQMTNKGLVAQADIAGTKYWKSKKLNR